MQLTYAARLTRNPKLLMLVLLSVLATGAVFYWHAHHDFSFLDEGFLWYGVQRVMKGEVPMRDFMAYDPGRYYWSAALMSIFGNNGLVALRATIAVFQGIGLFLALALIGRGQTKSRVGFWIVTVLTLVAWMFPRWKLYDIAISIILVATYAFLIERPTYRRYLFAGVIVGLAAFFGRNHGLYGALGGLAIQLWLAYKREDGISSLKGFMYWSIGILIGYSPMLLMAALIPGFAQGVWETIEIMIQHGASNLALPVPWPWRASDGVQRLVGVYFILAPLFSALSIAYVVRKKFRGETVAAPLVACAFMSLPYLHHMYARADSFHLAQGIFPVLIGAFILLRACSRKWVRWSLLIILAVTSMRIAYYDNIDWNCFRSDQCVRANIGGDTLAVDKGTADDVKLFDRLVKDFAPNGQLFLAIPFRTGAYALYDRESPVWETYATVHRSKEFEEAEIARLKKANVGFVYIFDFALDGHDSLRFRYTHPLTYQYIVSHFDRLTAYTDNRACSCELFKSRSSKQGGMADAHTSR